MPPLLVEGIVWPGMGPPGRGPLWPPRPVSALSAWNEGGLGPWWGRERHLQAKHTPLPQPSDCCVYLLQVCLGARNGRAPLRSLVGVGKLPLMKVTAVEEGKGGRA